MKNTKFNWCCAWCGKRNIDIIKFQFDIPNHYKADWPCEKCGKLNSISFSFNIIQKNQQEYKNE